MCTKPRVFVIGSYAVGMTMVTNRFPVGGETVLGRDFAMLHGGKGSNQAVAAARLGGDVRYCGCIGNDSFGDNAMELFQQEGLHASAVKRSKAYPTGVGFVIVNAHGENEIVIDFGANNDIKSGDIDAILPMLEESDIVLMQLEVNIDAVVYAAKKCKALNKPLILNPAPFQRIPAELLECCEYLTPNETEARLLLGCQPDDPISHEAVAQKLLDLGVKNIVMTLGSKGALIANARGFEYVGGVSVTAVDTTGAGDTFSAALAVALGEGKQLCEAVRFANTAAALSVTKYGVIPSLPLRKEVEEKR